jgi:hypothetical protein
MILVKVASDDKPIKKGSNRASADQLGAYKKKSLDPLNKKSNDALNRRAGSVGTLSLM